METIEKQLFDICQRYVNDHGNMVDAIIHGISIELHEDMYENVPLCFKVFSQKGYAFECFQEYVGDDDDGNEILEYRWLAHWEEFKECTPEKAIRILKSFGYSD
jgi:hypothetical protein